MALLKRQGDTTSDVVDELEDIGSVVSKFFRDFQEESKKSRSLQKQIIGISKEEKKDRGFKSLGDIIGESNKSVTRSISDASDGTRRSIDGSNRILSQVSHKMSALAGISELFSEVKKSNKILSKTEKIQEDIAQKTQQSSLLRLKLIENVLESIYTSVFKGPSIQEHTLQAVINVERAIRGEKSVLLGTNSLFDNFMLQVKEGRVSLESLLHRESNDTKAVFNYIAQLLNKSNVFEKEIKLATLTGTSTVEMLLKQTKHVAEEVKKVKVGIEKNGVETTLKSIFKSINVGGFGSSFNVVGEKQNDTRAKEYADNIVDTAKSAGKNAADAFGVIYEQAVKPLSDVAFGNAFSKRVGGVFSQLMKRALDSSPVQLSLAQAIGGWESTLVASFVTNPLKTTKAVLGGFNFLWKQSLEKPLALSVASLHAQFGIKGAIFGAIAISFGKILKKINPEIEIFNKATKDVEKTEKKTSSAMQKLKRHWANLPDYLTIFRNKDTKSVRAAQISLLKKKFEQSAVGGAFGKVFKSRSKDFAGTAKKPIGDTLLGEIKIILTDTNKSIKNVFASQKGTNKITNNTKGGDFNLFGVGGLSLIKKFGIGALLFGKNIIMTLWKGLRLGFRFAASPGGLKAILSGLLPRVLSIISPVSLTILTGNLIYELFKKIFSVAGISEQLGVGFNRLFSWTYPIVDGISNFIDAIIKPFSSIWENFKERFAIEFPGLSKAFDKTLGVGNATINRVTGNESVATEIPAQSKPDILKVPLVTVQQNTNSGNGNGKSQPINVVVPPSKIMPSTSVENTLVVIGQMGH